VLKAHIHCTRRSI